MWTQPRTTIYLYTSDLHWNPAQHRAASAATPCAAPPWGCSVHLDASALAADRQPLFPSLELLGSTKTKHIPTYSLNRFPSHGGFSFGKITNHLNQSQVSPHLNPRCDQTWHVQCPIWSVWARVKFNQRPFQEAKLEVPTMYKTYVRPM
jgi:hypothetical protein